MNAPSMLSQHSKKMMSRAVHWMSHQLQKRVPYSADNPFLQGAFAPVQGEYSSSDFKITGQIPAALNGTLLRMGPNPMAVENPAIYNWFIGDGMIHGLRLNHGKAEWYHRRYIGVDDVNRKLQRPAASGPRRGPSHVVNTNAFGHAGNIWALVEAGAYPVALDGNLDTIRHGLFANQADLPFTAHPHVDAGTGELHAICYDGMIRNKVFYLNIDKDGKLKHKVEVPVKHGPMIHDCAITQNHVLILDLPITFSFRRLITGSMLPYGWNRKHKARVGVLPKTGEASDVRWFEVEPCFIFHTCNAFELDNGDIVMDAVVHEHAFLKSAQGPVEGQKVRFERWTLQQATGKVQRKVISMVHQEFPRLDERLTGKPYRYAYAVTFGSQQDSPFSEPEANQLLKHDLHTGTTIAYDYGKDYASGEVIFVPKHAQAQEDEGWLISYVHRLDGGNSKVVILDAQQLEQPPVATIELPVRVPLGFHANWVAVLI